MSNLNISLHTSHTQTTRKSFRVVWLLGLLVGWWISIWIVTELWFTQPITLTQKTKTTEIATELLLQPHTWELLQQKIGAIPLVSNRALTLTDIAPWTPRAGGWLWQTDGSHAFILQTTKDKLPMKLLQNHHIIVTELTPSLILLSEKVPEKTDQPSKVPFWRKNPLYPHKTFAGTSEIKTTSSHWEQGSLFVTQSEFTAEFAKQSFAKGLPNTQNSNTILAIATPVQGTSNTQRMSQTIDALLKWLKTPTASMFSESFLQNEGWISITQTEDGWETRWQFPTAILSDNDRQQLLKTISAFRVPVFTSWQLPDKTIVQETRIDENQIRIETSTNAGQQVITSYTGNTKLYALAWDEKNTILSSEQKTTTTPEEKIPSACAGNHAQVAWSAIQQQGKHQIQDRTFDMGQILAQHIKAFGINSNTFATTLTTCTQN